jgi:ribosomal protein S25
MNKSLDENISENLYQLAKSFIIGNRVVSISLLQRRFKIGYSHALDLMEQLEKGGVVTRLDSLGSRTLIGQHKKHSCKLIKEVKTMIELPVHTLITDENKEGGLLLCGLNHGYSKEDERQDAAGVDRSDSHKSFFSDVNVNGYKFRNRIVTWFSLWGHPLVRLPEDAGPFERSIHQTNWLQTCSNNVKDLNIEDECIEDSDSFLQTCAILKPRVLFFFGKDLMWAFSSKRLSDKVESIFGEKIGKISWHQKDIYSNGKLCRRLRFGFLHYERLTVVVLPHATGAQGVSDDYIESFKPEMSAVIDTWWERHKAKLLLENVI